MSPGGEYRYPQTPVFLDLVPAEDRRLELGGAFSFKPMQDLFRSPLTSFLYERGWRVRKCVGCVVWCFDATHSIAFPLTQRPPPHPSTITY